MEEEVMSDAGTYRIVRRYFEGRKPRVMKRGLSLKEAQKWCQDPETSSRTCTTHAAVYRTKVYGPWFDGYEKE